MSDFMDITYEKKDWVATVTIERPGSYNSYTTRTLKEMARAFRDASEDDGAFSVERVNRESRPLFVAVQDAWDRDDVASWRHWDGVGRHCDRARRVARDPCPEAFSRC